MKNIKIFLTIIAVAALTACSRTTSSLIDTNSVEVPQDNETKNLYLDIFDNPNFKRGHYVFETKSRKGKVHFRATYGIYETADQNYDVCIRQYEHLENTSPLIQYTVSLITKDVPKNTKPNESISVKHFAIDNTLETLSENFTDAALDEYIILSKHLDYLFDKYQRVDSLKYHSLHNLNNHDEFIKNNLLLLNNSPPSIQSVY